MWPQGQGYSWAASAPYNFYTWSYTIFASAALITNTSIIIVQLLLISKLLYTLNSMQVLSQ